MEAGGTRYEVHQCAAKPTENPSRSEGAQEQREAAASALLAFPLLQPTPSRRRRHRPRRYCSGIDYTAPIVAAFERISINEPVMAGPSSSASTEGPLSRSSLSFLCVIVVDLGLCCIQIKKEREILLDSCTV